MRRIRYQVAMSLDGFIAGPNGEADWISPDPEIDFAAIFAQFDTFLMGRKTYEAARPMLPLKGKEVVVFSRTLEPANCPGVTLVAENAVGVVGALRDQPGRDIWLFGGGLLFRSLLEAGLVDTVEVAVCPVLLGRGIPLLPGAPGQTRLELTGHKVYQSGKVLLQYATLTA